MAAWLGRWLPTPRLALAPVLGLVWVLAQLGCGSLSGQGAVPAAVAPSLRGQVVDESGAPLAEARVSWRGGAAQAVAADGKFLAATGETASVAGLPGLLTVAAPGYASVYRPLGPMLALPQDLGQVPLRRSSPVETVALPAPGAPPVTVTEARDDAAATLELAAGQLVDGAGRAVTGAVDVALDFWHPAQSLDSAPALLLAARGSGTVSLSCFGMVGLDIYQAGAKLAVAPGQRLTLHVKESDAVAARWPQLLPSLYALGSEDGLWHLEGTLADGTLSFDAASQTATAKLAHMSYYNIDSALEPDNGGCVSGRAMNACQPSQPLSNSTVKLWLFSYEQLISLTAKTDVQGQYCMPVSLADWLISDAKKSGSPIVSNYMVTGANIENTVMCDPLPGGCRICNPIHDTWGNLSAECNRCQLDVKAAPWLSPGPPYHDTCTPPTPTLELTPCQFCAGSGPSSGVCTATGYPKTPVLGACTKLPDAYIKADDCHCASLDQTCSVADGACCPSALGVPAFCNPSTLRCTPCVVFKQVYSPCSTDQPCCTPANEKPLTCADGICLPLVAGPEGHARTALCCTNGPCGPWPLPPGPERPGFTGRQVRASGSG